MTIAILVIISRSIAKPVIGENYIVEESTVLRFDGSETLDSAMAKCEAKFPSALSFCIYRPRSDSSAQVRY